MRIQQMKKFMAVKLQLAYVYTYTSQVMKVVYK